MASTMREDLEEARAGLLAKPGAVVAIPLLGGLHHQHLPDGLNGRHKHALSLVQSLGTLLVNSHCLCMADQFEFPGQQPASMRERARTLRQIARATSLVVERKQMLVLAKQLEEKAASQEAHGVRPEADD